MRLIRQYVIYLVPDQIIDAMAEYTLALDALVAGDPHALIIAVVSLGIAALLGYLLLVGRDKTALDPDNFLPFRLIRITSISHDTRHFTFALQTPTTTLGLPVGQHISFRFTESSSGKTIQRTYTPVTGNEIKGEVSFVIKVYKAGVHPKFPDGGKMSQHLDSLAVGDSLEMKGPKGVYMRAEAVTEGCTSRQPLSLLPCTSNNLGRCLWVFIT